MGREETGGRAVNASVLATAAGTGAWIQGLQDAVARGTTAIEDSATAHGRLPVGQLKGFIAEHWHAGTFNVDAYKKGLDGLTAVVPESNLGASPDIIVFQDGGEIARFQSKYYGAPKLTETNLSHPQYGPGAPGGAVGKLGPADQIEAIREVADRQAARNVEIRPGVSEQHAHTRDVVSGKVAAGGASSEPLTKSDAEQLARDAKAGRVPALDASLSAREIAGHAARAGAVAAGIAATLSAAPDLIEALRRWQGGRDDWQKALRSAGSKALHGGFAGGLRGAVAGGLTLAVGSGYLGGVIQGLTPAVQASVVGALTVVVFEAVRDAWSLHIGEITRKEFLARCLTKSVVTVGGACGAAVGQALIPIPVLGALLGSMLGAALARAGFQIGPKLYHAVVESMDELKLAALNMFRGWTLLEQARRQSAEIEEMFHRIDDAVRVGHEADGKLIDLAALSAIDLDGFAVALGEDERELRRLREAFEAL